MEVPYVPLQEAMAQNPSEILPTTRLRADFIARMVRKDYSAVGKSYKTPTPQEERAYYNATVEQNPDIAGIFAVTHLLDQMPPVSSLPLEKLQKDPVFAERLFTILHQIGQDENMHAFQPFASMQSKDQLSSEQLFRFLKDPNLRNAAYFDFLKEFYVEELMPQLGITDQGEFEKIYRDAEEFLYPNQTPYLKMWEYLHSYALKLDDKGLLTDHPYDTQELAYRTFNMALRNRYETFKSEASGRKLNLHGNNEIWQVCRYGTKRDTSTPDYKGYVMLDPHDLPRVLDLVQAVGKQRLKNGKSTEFKWMTGYFKGENFSHYFENPRKIGDYKGADHALPMIVFYTKDQQEIFSILESLAQSKDSLEIEERRWEFTGGNSPENAPRRPNTHAYETIINGEKKSLRWLNYNDHPGESENQEGVDQKGVETIASPGTVYHRDFAIDEKHLVLPEKVTKEVYDPYADSKNNREALPFSIPNGPTIEFQVARPDIAYPVLVNRILRANKSNQTVLPSQVVFQTAEGIYRITPDGQVIQRVQGNNVPLGFIDTSQPTRLRHNEPFQAYISAGAPGARPVLFTTDIVENRYIFRWQEETDQSVPKSTVLSKLVETFAASNSAILSEKAVSER